jgi:hypothetical protein
VLTFDGLQFGYYFPVNEQKYLLVKDDSSLYRFQVRAVQWQAAPRAVQCSAVAPLAADLAGPGSRNSQETLRSKMAELCSGLQYHCTALYCTALRCAALHCAAKSGAG